MLPRSTRSRGRPTVGIDVVGVDRVRRLLERPAAAAELFTPDELAYCAGRRRRYEHLAARFAAKEAVLKAIGTGLGARMQWTDVEVVNDLHGRPRAVLHGEVARAAARRDIVAVALSLSHSDGMATAVAVGHTGGDRS
jgi:holo-[acyl-carrier protein] synthase